MKPINKTKILTIIEKHTQSKEFLTYLEVHNIFHDLGNMLDPTIDALCMQLDPTNTEKIPYHTFIKALTETNSELQAIKQIIECPSTKIIEILKKSQKEVENTHEKSEIDWAVSMIESNKIYNCAFEENDFESSSEEAEDDMVGWLNEYSTKKEKLTFYVKTTLQSKSKISDLKLELPPYLNILQEKNELLQQINLLDMDMFSLCSSLGRELTLPLVSLFVLKEHNLLQMLDSQRLFYFLNQIYVGYRKDTSYHTDIHAADVTQMCHVFLSIGKLKENAKLTNHEVLAFIISAIIHDYKHMGLTNAFHENSKSSLAIRYNDISILENYHIAQAFKLIGKDATNIFKGLSEEEFKLIKKIIIYCVLSTDMQKHAALMASLNKYSSKDLKEEENKLQIENKNELLGICLHAADISNSSRSFPICQKWTMKLMEEFWRQGDLEKKSSLPISFLCDRMNANVPASQIGFINGITKPMFSMLSGIMPNISVYVEVLQSNVLNWRMLQLEEKMKKISLIGDDEECKKKLDT